MSVFCQFGKNAGSFRRGFILAEVVSQQSKGYVFFARGSSELRVF